MLREIKFSEALAEATVHAMEENPKVFIMGEGVDDPKGAFGTTLPAMKKFGRTRVMDTPLSESAITGIGIGAALEGHPCMMVHMRSEFLLVAMDQIVNHAAKWRYMFAGAFQVPIVVRCLVGRGWGQAAQHSQTFHSLFAHVPGLKVVLPATPIDAKGLLLSAIRDPNPVIFIEHRWLYDKKAHVPAGPFSIPIGQAHIIAPGTDVTCVAFSHQVYEALLAREELAKLGISLEVIDARTVYPLDKITILNSVKNTGRLIIADIGHLQFGVTAEIAAIVSEEAFDYLKAPIARIGLPHFPTPCSSVLEKAYYPGPNEIVQAAKSQMARGDQLIQKQVEYEETPQFTGPF